MHPFLLICLQITIASCLSLLCHQSLAAPSSTLRFEQLGAEQGLMQHEILSFAQDHQGFMWLGSRSALIRYDGYRMIVYKHQENNPHSLSQGVIRTLYVDKKGRLWVGIGNGLNRFDPATEHFIHYSPKDLAGYRYVDSNVRAMLHDGQDGLWLATKAGLLHFDMLSERFKAWKHDSLNPSSLSNDDLLALAHDAKGDLWIGSTFGLDRLAAGQTSFEHFQLDTAANPNEQHNTIRSLLVDKKNRLWIGTYDGLEVWQLGQNKIQKHRFGSSEGLNPGRVTSVFQDKDDHIWIGTEREGLKRWDPDAKHFIAYQHQPSDPNSLADNNVSNLFEDRTGTLWVGTWSAGASRIDLASGGFAPFVQSPGNNHSLSSNKISDITGDNHGRIWLATLGGGLNLLDPISGKVKIFRHSPNNPQSLADDQVVCLTHDKLGQLWVGTKTGLNRFDPQTGYFTKYLFSTGGPDANNIQTIFTDHAGILWIGTLGGLHRMNPTTSAVQTFLSNSADPASISNNYVTSILEDNHGELWIGTGSGLNRLDRTTDRFRHFRHDPQIATSISHNAVNVLYKDIKGRIWIGTEAGLNLMERNAEDLIQFRTYHSSERILGILEDLNEHLWISNDTGIVDLNPVTGKWHQYSGHDGVIMGAYYRGSAYRDSSGILYFGGVKGMTSFRPETIHTNPYPPAVAITDLQIFNNSVRGNKLPDGVLLDGALENAKKLTLSYRHSLFSIEFAALHYANPQRNLFAYQLQGIDNDWIFTNASKRFITYSHLAPGHYVFRVKAANKDGVWNENGATLEITITPPYWQTWWFRCSAILLALGCAGLAYHLRIRLLMKQKKILEHQIMLRTAEVQQKNSELEQKNIELSNTYHALEEVSLTDPLTGLRNRRFLMRQIDHDIERCLRRYTQNSKDRISSSPEKADIGLFLIDIDHFKAVNDTYGHARGDAILVQMCERLRKVSRQCDYIIRWGGEEFLLVAPEINRSEAELIAERIRTVVSSNEFTLEEGSCLSKTCSIGFACFPFLPSTPNLLSWEQVVEIADIALYMAKNGGRNAWVGLDHTTQTQSEDILKNMHQNIEQALQENQIQIIRSTM